MKNIFCSGKLSKCGNSDIGLLLIRIAIAVIFIVFGWMKISNMTMTVGFFATLGISAFWAYVATIVELLGGIAVLLGVFLVPAAALLAVTMVVAVAVVTGKGGFPMYYPNALILLTLIGLAMTGPGKYALGKKHSGCQDGTCGTCNADTASVPKM